MRAPTPRPWDAPGYTFSIGWPLGYEPQLAHQLAAERSSANSISATRARQAGIESGAGWGCGTMAPLSSKSDPARSAVTDRAPMRRQTAQKLGLARYWTGLPCVAGHRAERFTASGSCVECQGARRAFRAAEPKPPRERAPRPLTAETYEGPPCRRGHEGLRYASSGHCVECQMEKKAARKAERMAA